MADLPVEANSGFDGVEPTRSRAHVVEVAALANKPGELLTKHNLQSSNLNTLSKRALIILISARTVGGGSRV